MSLTGFWMNELKSVVLLKEHRDGRLTGKYRSIVGRDPHPRPLEGFGSPDESGKRLVGFAVQFHIDNPGDGSGHSSMCTWSGWSRDERITTHWLLTLDYLDPKNDWASTLIGEDCFERVMGDDATEELIESDIARLKTLLTESRAKR